MSKNKHEFSICPTFPYLSEVSKPQSVTYRYLQYAEDSTAGVFNMQDIFLSFAEQHITHTRTLLTHSFPLRIYQIPRKKMSSPDATDNPIYPCSRVTSAHLKGPFTLISLYAIYVDMPGSPGVPTGHGR